MGSACISVGNLSMGGRGKTPVVIHLARLLIDAGERPAVLSRGYGRRLVEPGVVVVSDGTHVVADLDRSGDEPLLIARSVPGAIVLVCEQRAIARTLAERALGATVVVLDDGFQHRQVARDVDLVLVTPDDLRGRRMPFGTLREPVSALSRAHALVSPNGSAGAIASAFPKVPTFSLNRSLGAPTSIEAERPWTGGRGPVVAVAGIAEPARFEASLKSAGWSISRLLTFGDHHRYGRRDLDRMAESVRETGAAGVVTTEKDAVRLRWMRPLPFACAVVPLEVSIEPSAAFRPWLFDRLREARQ
ncbi:MAG TPA: tetraacyldisaccharide 4'-kinase [Vicinamibacterales bacterium]|nr:tetraacyldisaccharide 4'-kinase [Vicinamibacterales bacterium]